MERELFYSKFKSSVGRRPLLDIIGDSPMGENPHRAVAMGLIFERTIHDCRERTLVQTNKSLQADHTVQPNNRREAMSALTAATQPTTTQPPKVRLPHSQVQHLSKLPTPQTNPNFFSGFTLPPVPPPPSQTIPNFFSLTSPPPKQPQAPTQSAPRFTFASPGNHDRK